MDVQLFYDIFDKISKIYYGVYICLRQYQLSLLVIDKWFHIWFHNGYVIFMGKKEKLFRKARNSPNNLSFEELCSLAKKFGFVYKGSNGDHDIYKHPDEGMMNFQSVNGKAKPYQVRQLINFIIDNDLIEE